MEAFDAGTGTMIIDYIRLYIGGCPPELGKLQLALSCELTTQFFETEGWYKERGDK